MEDPTPAPAEPLSDDGPDPRMTAALEWFVRLRDPSATEEDHRAFAAWKDADPANADAFARAGTLWERFDGVASEAAGRRRTHFNRRKLIIGGAVVSGGAAALLKGRPDLFADIRTGPGERRRVALAGGGWSELGSDSALTRQDGPEGERLTLYRGEGLFVAAGHALTVAADLIDVRLRDGACDVKRIEGEVTVAVESGTAWVEAPPFAPLTVAVGWQALCRAGEAPVLARADLDVVTAWRHDRLVFRDTPLSRVAAELDRYRRGRILLLGEGLAALTVTAAFDARRTEAALDALGDTLPIRLTRLTPFLTVIRRI